MAAPDEATALEVLETIQNLSPAELNSYITDEVGEPMLGIFSALAQAQDPNAGEEEIAHRVHLMVLSYLMRCEVEFFLFDESEEE